jgi:hypothetical protein
MAAIMHAWWGDRSLAAPSVLVCPTDVCYTFGMPRYGNRETVSTLRTPWHVSNKGDIVPGMPPRRFGYANCAEEYLTNGRRWHRVLQLELMQFGAWAQALASGKGIKAHMMERYLYNIRCALELGGY